MCQVAVRISWAIAMIAFFRRGGGRAGGMGSTGSSPSSGGAAPRTRSAWRVATGSPCALCWTCACRPTRAGRGTRRPSEACRDGKAPVPAGLGDDHLGGAFPTPGIVHSSSTCRERADLLLDLHRECAMSRRELDVGEQCKTSRRDARGSGRRALRSSGSFLRSLPLASSASASASACPLNQLAHHRPPRDAHPSVATHASFTPASSRTLCSRLTARPRS